MSKRLIVFMFVLIVTGLVAVFVWPWRGPSEAMEALLRRLRPAPTSVAVTPYVTPVPLIPPLPPVSASIPRATKTVFLIVMENKNWSDIVSKDDAPYVVQTLLPLASHAEQYFTPPGLHPSEPNYLWLEAGTNFGVKNDRSPADNHQDTPLHLVTLLDKAGISWKSYQEGISGSVCPVTNDGLYATRHNPMVYFDDVTNHNDPNSAYCIAHIRPYAELAADLRDNNVARYNYITPNLCDDMHNKFPCSSFNRVKNGDQWLQMAVPDILNSQAYKDGGVLIIAWDEGGGDSQDGPMGLIVLSPNAKGNGYANHIYYTHSSTLRTIQEIFGVYPLLGDAANATSLSDLFATYP